MRTELLTRLHRSISRGEQEQVRISLSAVVVDALFAGEGNEPDVRHALISISLDSAFTGDLVRVDDGKSRVRVWVD